MKIVKLTQEEVNTWNYDRCANNARHYATVLARHEMEPAALQPLYREQDEECRSRLRMIGVRLAQIKDEWERRKTV